MTNFRRILSAVAFAALLVGPSITSPAQNQSGTVVERRVRFARGSSSATLTGRAKYGMSYVYIVGARSGQSMTLSLRSSGRDVAFSLIGPDEDTKAFLSKSWSGRLPLSGDYSIVLVNNERGSSAAYTLTVSIQ